MQHAICGKCIGLEARALARTSYACISPVCSLVICKVTVLIRVMTTSQGCYKMQMKSRMCKNSVNCKVLSSRRHHNYFSGALSLSQEYTFTCFLECQQRFLFTRAWAQMCLLNVIWNPWLAAVSASNIYLKLKIEVARILSIERLEGR